MSFTTLQGFVNRAVGNVVCNNKKWKNKKSDFVHSKNKLSKSVKSDSLGECIDSLDIGHAADF